MMIDGGSPHCDILLLSEADDFEDEWLSDLAKESRDETEGAKGSFTGDMGA